jgi:hypothetical protein
MRNIINAGINMSSLQEIFEVEVPEQHKKRSCKERQGFSKKRRKNMGINFMDEQHISIY